MTSKEITEKKPDAAALYQWQNQAELSPSLTQDTEPLWGRVIGGFGLFLVVLGGVVILAHNMEGGTWVPKWLGFLLSLLTWIPKWVASLAAIAGLGGLLFHAASDGEQQVRRAYMVFGGLWLLLGVALTLSDIRLLGGTAAGRVGYFLAYGLPCLMLGLLFLMSFLRNETDVVLRQQIVWAIGANGAAMAIVAFLFGSVFERFLFSHGLLLLLVGFFYLWAFFSFQKITNDLGYRAAVVMGGVGLLVFLVALLRSFLQTWIKPEAGPYFIPSGVLLMGAGVIYAGLAAGLVSEFPFVVMTRRQLGAFFCSPIAYFMLLLFTVVAFFQFWIFVQETLLDPRMAPPEPIVGYYIMSLVPIFCLIFLVPVLTMHLLSEESRNGTLEMTLTAPQEETTIVLSKFTAALIMFLLTWVPWGLFLVALRVEGGQPFDYLPILAWFIVLLFSGAGFISMGLFFSSLTRNQLTAAVLTFVGMLLLVAFFLLQRIFDPGSVGFVLLQRVSFVDVWWHSLEGKLGMTDLIYHLSVTVFWLFLTVKVLELRKWR